MAKKRKAKAKTKKKPGNPEKAKFLQGLGVTYSKELALKATAWELEFREKLDKAQVHYIFQHPVVCEQNYLYIIDFYLPEYKIAFELDGAHHYEKAKIKSDAQRTKRIAALGIFVKRIMNRNVSLVTPQMLFSYLEMQLLKK